MITTASKALFRRWQVDATPGDWLIPERPPRHLRILQRAVLGAFVFTFALLLTMIIRSPHAASTSSAIGVLISLPIIAYWYGRPRLVFTAGDVEPGSAFEADCEAVLVAYRAAVARASTLARGRAAEARREADVLASAAVTAAWNADESTMTPAVAMIAGLNAIARGDG